MNTTTVNQDTNENNENVVKISFDEIVQELRNCVECGSNKIYARYRGIYNNKEITFSINAKKEQKFYYLMVCWGTVERGFVTCHIQDNSKLIKLCDYTRNTKKARREAVDILYKELIEWALEETNATEWFQIEE